MTLNNEGKRIAENNLAVIEKWVNECPKTHRLKTFEATINNYMTRAGVVIRNGFMWRLEIGNAMNWRSKHHKWEPVEVPYCRTWQAVEEEQKKHDDEIHELRKKLPHRAVYSDRGSLRVQVDGVELLFGGVGGDGAHKVWFVTRNIGERSTLLSYGGQLNDTFNGAVRGKHLCVFEYDCSGEMTVYNELYSTVQTFEFYTVTQGWKIERVIEG